MDFSLLHDVIFRKIENLSGFSKYYIFMRIIGFYTIQPEMSFRDVMLILIGW